MTEEKGKVNLKFICSAVALAVGIAVFVLALLNKITPISAISLIAIGMICIAFSNLIRK